MSKRFTVRTAVRAATLALLAASAVATAQQQAAEPPIVIDSVNNEYDLRNGLTRFWDDVSIERGAMKVSADEGLVRQADGEIVSIELTGNPTRWEDRLEDGSLVQGEARRIVFDVQENVVTLSDGARIRHEQGEFTGDELIYDLDTENLVGRGSAGNRARVVIEPEAMRRREPESTAEPPSAPVEDAAAETTTETPTEEVSTDAEPAPVEAAAAPEDEPDAEEPPVDPPADPPAEQATDPTPDPSGAA